MARRAAPVVTLEGATLARGERVLWEGVDLELEAGEFLAVLGPNGAGKTTLLRILLGLEPLTAGRVAIEGHAPRRGSARIGYIPQQRTFDVDLPARGRDLVRLGLDGHRVGLPLTGRAVRRRVDAAIAAVGAQGYADAPVGLLSGGEQQRLRVAQSLLGDPRLLLCDEPLLSLDLAHQREVTRLIDERRRAARTAVVFVTHEINPVLPFVDRVLYLVGGRWAIGRPHEVLTSAHLSALYGTPVEVVHVHGRVLIVASQESPPDGHEGHVEGGPPEELDR